MKQFTRKEAIALARGGEWKDWTDEEIVKVQLYQDLVCVDWGRFREAIENVLGRGVFTHEFARPDLLIAEYEGKRPRPTFEEIMDLIPKHVKVIGIMIDDPER